MRTFRQYVESRSLQNEADIMGAIKGAWQGLKQGWQGQPVAASVPPKQGGNFGSEMNALSSTLEQQTQQTLAKFPNIPEPEKQKLLQLLNQTVMQWSQPLLNTAQVSPK